MARSESPSSVALVHGRRAGAAVRPAARIGWAGDMLTIRTCGHAVALVRSAHEARPIMAGMENYRTTSDMGARHFFIGGQYFQQVGLGAPDAVHAYTVDGLHDERDRLVAYWLAGGNR